MFHENNKFSFHATNFNSYNERSIINLMRYKKNDITKKNDE